MRLIQTLALGLLCLFYTAVAVADYRDDIGFTRLHDEPGKAIAGAATAGILLNVLLTIR